MKTKIFAGLVLALSLLAPAFSAPSNFAVGALHVEQVSEAGPAVILIPGLASGSWVWSETLPSLRDRYSVYLVTVAGFDGRTAQTGVTLESLQRDLLTLIESRNIQAPVLAGHSMGGILALKFASGHSAAISGVIAVDGLPVFPGTESTMGDRSALAARGRAQFAGQTPAQFSESQHAYMKRIGSIDEATARKLGELSSRSDPAATADFVGQLLELDLRPQLGAIKVPVVEISPFYAADFAPMGVDEAGKAAYYRALFPGLERLEIVSISPARHFVMFDQPEKFATALNRALAGMAVTAAAAPGPTAFRTDP